MSELPDFQKVASYKANTFVTGLFGKDFVSLTSFDDKHFRVIFRQGVFSFLEEQTEPTASQWSTLKKRLKRHNRKVFLFKETGRCDCLDSGGTEACYYLDFGFFME